MMLCYYEVGARSGFIRKAEIFTSNFLALANDLNTLPRKLGKRLPNDVVSYPRM